MRIPKRIVQLPTNANLHRDDVLAIVDQNNRTSKISLLQLAEFLSGTSQTLSEGNNYVTEGEYDDVGKEIILSRNDGAQIKITGFTGGQDVYTNDTPVPEKVGGIEEGTTFVNKTMEEVFNMLFYPTLEPTQSPPNTELRLNYSGVMEIGTPLDLELSNTADGGSWNQNWQGSDLQPDNYAGEVLTAKIEYTGEGSFNNINSLQITGKYGLENVGYNNYEVVEGNQSWKLKTTFAPGQDPINSDGNVSQVVTKFGGGELNSTKSITGAYPIYIVNENGTFNNPPLISHSTSPVTISINFAGTAPGAATFEFQIPKAFGTPSNIVQKDPFGNWGTLNQLGIQWQLSSITRNTNHKTQIEYWKFLWNNVKGKIGAAEFKITI